MTTDGLRRLANEYIKEHSIQDLSDQIGISRTTLSLWVSGKYKSDGSAIEKRIEGFFSASSLSRKDEQVLQRITELLHRAENRTNIIAALTLRR
jgi:DNA transposition AAA+ family ATPase